MLCKYMKQFEHKKHSSTTALASNTQFFFFVNVAAQTALLCLLCSSAQQKDAAEVWLHKKSHFHFQNLDLGVTFERTNTKLFYLFI